MKKYWHSRDQYCNVLFSTIICSEFEIAAIAAMNHEIDSEHKFVSIASFKHNFYNNSFDKFLQIYLYKYVMIMLEICLERVR